MTGAATREPAEYRHDPHAPPTTLNRVRLEGSSLGGRPVVVKRATGRSRARLRREAAVLASLPPGVAPAVRRIDEGEHATALVLDDVRGPALDAAPAHDDDDLAVVVLGLCRAVAALHRSGWAHGRIRAEHVLAGRHGVVLCSLAEATALPDHPGGCWIADPTRPDPAPGPDSRAAHEAAAADDLATLELLGDLMQRQPGRRASRRRRRALHRLDAARHSARAGAPVDLEAAGQRIATALGRRAGTTAPTPARGGTTGSLGPPHLARALRRAARPRPALRMAALAATVALVGPAAGPLGATTDGRPAAGATGTGSCSPRPHGAAASWSACAAVVVRGRRIRVGGTTFEVGAPGDRVAVADWDCDGDPTAVVVRPTTGEVFTFDGWARPGAPSTSSATVVVPGAVGVIAPGPGADECGPPAVRRADGSIVTPLDPGAGP